jgi:Heavy metal binding domain
MKLLVFSLILICCFAYSRLPVPVMAYQGSALYACPMHLDIKSASPGQCSRCGMKLVAQSPSKPGAAQQVDDEFTCPMHPEVKSKGPGKCPKCGMSLVRLNVDPSLEYQVKLTSAPVSIVPKEKVRLDFAIFNSATGEQVKQFAVVHEKLLHLFIVSQDMTVYQHIHPELRPDGSFVIEAYFPQPGHYKLYAEFQPAGGMPQVLQKSLTTAGYKSDLFASQVHLAQDDELDKTVDGTDIELRIVDQLSEPTELTVGKPVRLKYYLKDAGTGKAVTDLVPYLGAWGHTLILSEDLSDYVHSHPTEQIYPGVSHIPNAELGWEVTFEALLPRPGNYKIWSQFQRGEKLTTVSFVIHAAEQVNADDRGR